MTQIELNGAGHSDRFFLKSIGLLAIIYLVLEIFVIPHLMLAYDEFWFAQHIYQYTQHLPYRDFLPYKTVLGYYVLSLPMWLVDGLWAPVFLIKDEIAVLNTLILCGISFYSLRFFDKKAILWTLIMVMSNQLFLLYSVDLRVDMLTSWMGLIAVLFVLYRRPMLAGIMVGIGFLFSQKALWFLIAINSAYVATLLIKETRRQTLRAVIGLNGASMLIIVIYAAFWSLVANPSSVFSSMLYEAYTQAKITWYSQTYVTYWKMIFANGPLLITLVPLTWLSLYFTTLTWNKIFILTFSTIMMLLIVSYQQAFPYNMVFAVPVFFLVYADFFSDLMKFIQKPNIAPVNRSILFGILFLYIALLAILFVLLEVTLPYYLILIIPLCLGLFICKPNGIFITFMLLGIFFTGIFYPALRLIEFTLGSLNDYQKFTVTLVHDLLKNEGGYVAGSPMLYFKKQSIPGLENLISPAIAYLYTGSPKLLPIMIPSLHLTPTTQADIIRNLTLQPVKLYVNNNRMLNLPPAILDHLHKEFSHYWGSIYIYTPTVTAAQKTFFLKFPGKYQIVAPSKAHIRIDHQLILPHAVINLKSEHHLSEATAPYRLKLIPTESSVKLLPEYERDVWQIAAK